MKQRVGWLKRYAFLNRMFRVQLKVQMHPSDLLSTSEVQACLERSGYLMESRLVRSLTGADFFVEPNVAHKDPRTGKTRELDLVAEYAKGNYSERVCVKTTFVIEAVNNRLPVVLLTERPSTPNADFENYIKFAWTPSDSQFFSAFHVYDEKLANVDNLFSQYCALTRKSNRDELMASHPDDLYSSLLKLAEYTEGELDAFRDWTADELGRYWRIFFWRPMLVVSGQLMLARVGPDGAVCLEETTIGRLEFNWHQAEERKTTVIEVVHENYLLKHLSAVRVHDDDIAGRLASFKATVENAATDA